MRRPDMNLGRLRQILFEDLPDFGEVASDYYDAYTLRLEQEVHGPENERDVEHANRVLAAKRRLLLDYAFVLQTRAEAFQRLPSEL